MLLSKFAVVVAMVVAHVILPAAALTDSDTTDQLTRRSCYHNGRPCAHQHECCSDTCYLWASILCNCTPTVNSIIIIQFCIWRISAIHCNCWLQATPLLLYVHPYLYVRKYLNLYLYNRLALCSVCCFCGFRFMVCSLFILLILHVFAKGLLFPKDIFHHFTILPC
jgi:hypothetical protein